jgi:hypothetical protein
MTPAAASCAGYPIILVDDEASAYTVPVVDGAVATRPWLRFMLKPLDYDVLHALIHDL